MKGVIDFVNPVSNMSHCIVTKNEIEEIEIDGQPNENAVELSSGTKIDVNKANELVIITFKIRSFFTTDGPSFLSEKFRIAIACGTLARITPPTLSSA